MNAEFPRNLITSNATPDQSSQKYAVHPAEVECPACGKAMGMEWQRAPDFEAHWWDYVVVSECSGCHEVVVLEYELTLMEIRTKVKLDNAGTEEIS